MKPPKRRQPKRLTIAGVTKNCHVELINFNAQRTMFWRNDVWVVQHLARFDTYYHGKSQSKAIKALLEAKV